MTAAVTAEKNAVAVTAAMHPSSAASDTRSRIIGKDAVRQTMRNGDDLIDAASEDQTESQSATSRQQHDATPFNTC